jgi:hypothetical protein
MTSPTKKMIRPVHPFPARMAPDLAFARLKRVPPGAIVLDPMSGSGTVLRQASELGHRSIGFDMDPLAVLMTKVWTTPVEDNAVQSLLIKTLKFAIEIPAKSISLPWIDGDSETKAFVNYWFGSAQKSDLRRLAFALLQLERLRSANSIAAANVLRIAFSRLIVAKESGASLARDVSHSRPHKVTDVSDFKVFPAFERSVRYLRTLLLKDPPKGHAVVSNGDARSLTQLKKHSIDVVMTSPPYLNAIDYMRGHRLALVWLGYSISDLRRIRSDSIGAERGSKLNDQLAQIEAIQKSMGLIDKLPSRHKLMVARYAQDIRGMMSEVARVLRPEGKAILVIGNSCLKNVFINNAGGIVKAASQVGLKLVSSTERELPDSKRYLPMPRKRTAALGRRMRTETILTFGVKS